MKIVEKEKLRGSPASGPLTRHGGAGFSLSSTIFFRPPWSAAGASLRGRRGSS